MSDKDSVLLDFLKKKENIYYLYISLITLFILLDYSIYTEVFHLSRASFIENYMYSIDLFSNSFLMIFVLIPLAILMYMYGVISLFLIGLNKYKRLIHTNKLKYYAVIFILVFVCNLITDTVFKFIKIPDSYIILFYSSLVLIGVYCSLKVIIFYSEKYKERNKIQYVFIYFFCFIIIFLLQYIPSFKFFIILYFAFIGTFLSYLNYKITQKTKISKDEEIVIPLMFILFIIYFVNKNILWNNIDTLSFNLILNRGYVSQNKQHLEVSSNIETTVKECNVPKTLILKTDSSVHYIPFFKDKEIYFVENNNLKCVYVVEEKKDGKLVLNDVGYIE